MNFDRIYFHLCLYMFIVANCFGGSFAWTYTQLPNANHWPAWRAGVGIMLLSASMVMSFCGHAICYRRLYPSQKASA
jgi:hypothetical protein